MKGNITRRGRSSWRLKYDAPSADGKRRTVYETVRASSKRDAQAKLTERLAAIGRGEHVEPSKTTITEHVKARIDVWHAAGTIGSRSFQLYGGLLDRYIRPHIGDTALQKLSTVDVEKWHATLRTAGLTARTIRQAHRLLGTALGDAARHKIITHNVAGREGQRAPKVERAKIEIVRANEIADVVEKLRSTAMFAPAMVALFCGLRAGEILALRWSSVDFEKRLLHVRESVEELAGQPVATKAPKTEAGNRAISMPDIVVDALRDVRREQLKVRLALGLGRPADDALVFPAMDGGFRRPSNLSRDWRRAGVVDVNFHALRHTHASQLIAAGIDVVLISTRLGHASPNVTLGIYAHLFDHDDRRAADAVNAMLGASRVPKSG